MISKDQKVPKELINHILKKGKTRHSKIFIIKYLENRAPELTKAELAKPESTNRALKTRFRAIVSRKISKKAVKRNKIRRRIYEAIRRFSQIKEIDAILIPKKIILTATFAEIKSDIDQWKN